MAAVRTKASPGETGCPHGLHGPEERPGTWVPSWGSRVHRWFKSEAKNKGLQVELSGPCPSLGGEGQAGHFQGQLAEVAQVCRGSLWALLRWAGDAKPNLARAFRGWPSPIPRVPACQDQGHRKCHCPGKSFPSCLSLPWAFPLSCGHSSTKGALCGPSREFS